jgi:hypothetical protein
MVKVEHGGGTVYHKKVTAQKNRAQLMRIVEVIPEMIQKEKINKNGKRSATWKGMKSKEEMSELVLG